MKKNKIKQNSGERALRARALSPSFPRLTLECAERYELLLCGCRKIELYSPEETVVSSGGGKVRVRGKSLRIAFMGESKIMLSGVIDAIEFI